MRSFFNTPFLARLICALGICFWCFFLTVKYYCFGFYDWDFALYSQTMWSLCHGTTFVSLFGTSFLADHAHFIAFLITPLYFIFPDPLTLIYLEVFSFFAGAYILYKLAEKLTSGTTALGLILIYILHPANIFMLLYEFHFESLGVGLIFLLFYFHFLERYRAFIITAILLMLVKENMPVIVFMTGVYSLFYKPAGRTKWGMVPMVLGMGMFLLTMFVITPLVRQHLPTHQNVYWGLFRSFGDTPVDMIKNLFLKPGIFIKQLVTIHNLHFLRDVLGGFIVGTLFYPPVLLLATPLFLQNLLSNNDAQHTIFYHYTATLVPFAAIGAAYGFAFLKRHYAPWFGHLCLVLCLLAAVFSFARNLPTMKRILNSSIDARADIRQAFIDKIPADAGVVANNVFLSHLTDRQNLYALYNVWMDIDLFTGQHPFIVPSTVHYALIDYDDPWVMKSPHYDQTMFKTKKFLGLGGWKLKYAKSGIALYER